MRVVIFGASGMVGAGVLLECVEDPRVQSVLVVGRTSSGIAHPKVREILHQDFFDYTSISAEFADCDACFFCLGVSSIGMTEHDYRQVTYDLTVDFARPLARLNPEMTFCYVTGAGTDSTEHGQVMWARIKGATENELLRLFRRAVMFRPAMMRATAGQRNLKGWYRALAWIYPIGRALAPGRFCTLQEVGRAMINAATAGAPRHVLEVRDIVDLAGMRAS